MAEKTTVKRIDFLDFVYGNKESRSVKLTNL